MHIIGASDYRRVALRLAAAVRGLIDVVNGRGAAEAVRIAVDEANGALEDMRGLEPGKGGER